MQHSGILVIILFGRSCGIHGDETKVFPGLFEGDIADFPPSLARAGIRSEKYRWPNATLSYAFDQNFPQNMRNTFFRATQTISNHTCIRFVNRTQQPDYVLVVLGASCWSPVGRKGGVQNISLTTRCHSIGIFMHEIIHALGFWHEQSRTDRDEYVDIIWKNIPENQRYNFWKYTAVDVSPFGVAYDYDSIMHYARNAFSANGADTIVPKNSNARIGQRNGLSQGDVTKLNNMYCPRL